MKRIHRLQHALHYFPCYTLRLIDYSLTCAVNFFLQVFNSIISSYNIVTIVFSMIELCDNKEACSPIRNRKRAREFELSWLAHTVHYSVYQHACCWKQRVSVLRFVHLQKREVMRLHMFSRVVRATGVVAK